MATNTAAWQAEAKGPLHVREAPLPTPGPDEVVVENVAIGLNPVDEKVAISAIFNIQYPAILGSSTAGVVHAVGSDVKHLKIGDRIGVATARYAGKPNSFGSFQKYSAAPALTTLKLAPNISFEQGASFAINPTVAASWLFGPGKPLDKPVDFNQRIDKQKKVFVSGGSSSVGGYAIQLAHLAGYTVITTASPKNNDYVLSMGATKVLPHSDPNIAALIKAEGPYIAYYDAIALPSTLKPIAEAVSAVGGGTIWSMQPPMGVTLPDDVKVVFHQFSYRTPENAEFAKWVHQEYIPSLINSGKLRETPVKVTEGLSSLQGALEELHKGVSAQKLVVKP